jgi:hypothetical protein
LKRAPSGSPGLASHGRGHGGRAGPPAL